jgi:O-antigen/teichoic acid export membrane protein
LLVRKLWSSPSLRSSFLFGLGGILFAVANILMARVLPEDEYGLVALVYALIQISLVVGPAGVDSVVIRRRLEPEPGTLWRVTRTSALTAVGMTLVGALLYPLSPVLLAMLAVGTVAGGINAVAAAHYQNRQRFTTAVAVVQNQNGVLLLGAALCLMLDVRRSWLACALLAAGYVISAAVGWSSLLARRGPEASRKESWFSWREGLFLVGVLAVDLLLVQMERVLIPRVLTLGHLATYAILAALVGSPYRVLQLGVRYTILPRIKAARTVAERRNLLRKEGLLAVAVVAGGSAAVWLVTPLMVRWFLAGKYDLAPALILAAIISGALRVASELCTSITTALGGNRQLGLLNAASAGAVVLAIVAATVGARWGIAGVIYGVCLGWLARIIAAIALAIPHLRLPAVHGPAGDRP